MVLRVKLEIVPFGIEEKAREIAHIDIFNKGETTVVSRQEYHQYGAIDLTPGEEGLFNEEILHKRSLGAWRLVSTVLNRLNIRGP